jgi:[ribosomal protein S5]-alanine N-acetyltransferase
VTVLETARLTLRRLSLDDAPFILRLVNEPSWLEFIGDKGVRNLDDARKYLREGPLSMYERYGFGLYMAQVKESGAQIGMCGLIKRDQLPDVDVGFALFPEFWGRGYAHEAAAGVLEHGRRAFDLKRVVAITSPHNDASIKVLEKIGMRFERMIEFTPGDPVRLFGRDFAP